MAGELEQTSTFIFAVLMIASQILDDGRRHALRVYQDQKTKAVRFQSSVLKGERDK